MPDVLGAPPVSEPGYAWFVVCVWIVAALILAGYAFVFWTVSFFVRVHGYDAAEAAQIFGWIFLLAGPLPVITPPHLRARVAAVYLIVGSLGMLLGPPIAGTFNEYVFPQVEGVRYSLVTVTTIFGLLGITRLQFARRPYAASLEEAEQRDN